MHESIVYLQFALPLPLISDIHPLLNPCLSQASLVTPISGANVLPCIVHAYMVFKDIYKKTTLSLLIIYSYPCRRNNIGPWMMDKRLF